MTRICFVCDEIYPARPGGAGSLIYNLACDLLAQGHQIILLLNLSEADFERFNNLDRLGLPKPEQCLAYHVDTLCSGSPFHEQDFLSRYDWESYCYDFACRQVYEREQPNLIEFVDFCGPAYYALCARKAGLSYQHSPIVIRVHGAIELIDRFAKAKPLDFDRYTIYALEREALRMADAVLYPTPSFLQEYYKNESKTWMGETVLSPPLVKDLFAPIPTTSSPNIVLFYGRLFAIKGADLFVDAVMAYINAHPNSSLEFHLVGYDSLEPPVEKYRSYREYLLTKIPVQSRSRFTFHGSLSPDQLSQILPRVKFAVFPSYFETFCLAAHELRHAGVPLILSSIPAFRDHFQPDNDALFFDGSLSDLVHQINFLDSNEIVRNKLSNLPTPSPSAALDFYEHPSLDKSREKKNTDGVSFSPPTLLVCILNETTDDSLLDRTLTSLKQVSSIQLQTLLLEKNDGKSTSTPSFWLLGDQYTLSDGNGHPIDVQQAQTRDALLILRAGDEVDVNYLSFGLNAIQLESRVAFVSCWNWVFRKKCRWINTFLLAAMTELLPFESLSPFSRTIMRTPPGISLLDLLDPRAGVMGEIAFLWKLTRKDGIGLQISAPLLTHPAEIGEIIDGSLVSYLILQDTSTVRQAQLACYMAMLTQTCPTPLKKYWAKKSGASLAQEMGQSNSILIWPNKRIQWIRKLERGGLFGRLILTFLRSLRRMLK